jgi:hypothetical protein
MSTTPEGQGGGPGMPAVRASDAERDRAATALRDAAGEGRLTLEELAERLDAAIGATTREELESLTADLPVSTTAAAPAAARAHEWVVGILGGGNRKGRWHVARRTTVVNVMGGADLDLRDALVDGAEIEIVVLSLMGGSDIVVPEGVAVDLGGFAVMGGNDLKATGPRPRRGAPVVRVRAYSVMGGTDVRTKPSEHPSGPRPLHGLHPLEPPG